MPNHLAAELSPYLLQHANNPVDWFPWGDEALKRARDEDKPIFLSIGYAACHWCHVMAHESFEDPETAAILNADFVCVKVDREERPDLDSIYMSAVVAMTGQGGWPMSVFLTPDLQPFYGGTYFPPSPRHGLPGFKELLAAISTAWKDQREEILHAGQRITDHLKKQANIPGDAKGLDSNVIASAAQTLIDQYDWKDGGWGNAPKFPQPMAIEFLLRRHLAGERKSLPVVEHVLHAMARGGMYDVVGGGFARYSTDASWRVPHFEKMLYDNAQLGRVYLHAWQVTGNAFFRRVAEQTLNFVAREMLSPEGGFYSSLDADSDGEEGKFYVWTQAEIRSALGEEAGFFETAYGVDGRGNREGRTVLQRALDDLTLASQFRILPEEALEKLDACHARLLAVRDQRVRPAMDDKVLTAWNGLALAAFAEAARVFQNDRYLQIAERNADFLLSALRPDGQLRRAWRAGQTSQEVFLEDHASLILGLLELYQADFQPRWFMEANSLANEMHQCFMDPAAGFFDTPTGSATLLTRPKDIQDNATPSGNALAVDAILKLCKYTGDTGMQADAERAFALVGPLAGQYPSMFATWLCAANFSLGKRKQLAIIGDLTNDTTWRLIAAARREYHPDLVIAASSYPLPDGAPALLEDRPLIGGKPTAYLCEGFLCRNPVTDPGELFEQLKGD